MKIELLNIDSIQKAQKEISSVGVDKASVSIMDKKAVMLAFKIYDCKFYHANLLKQEALSLGMECAVEKDTITAKTKISNCLLFGDIKRLLQLSEKLKTQSFEFARNLSKKLDEYIKGYLSESVVFAYKNKQIDLKSDFLIMGILNVTPDSFSDGGDYKDKDRALKRVEEMIKEGADIIDIGGESTRPGSEPVKLQEELDRVMPILEAVKSQFDIDVSVDTYKSAVAKEALKLNADIINDISGLNFDDKMAEVLKNSDCGIIAMHIKGKPKDMQKNPTYKHLMSELNEYFENVLKKTDEHNIKRERVVLDPGIGFGKTYDDNLKILNNIQSFSVWQRPVLIGLSRKSFIGHILNEKNPKNRLFGSISANVVSFLNGARIFRVHDIKATKDALTIAQSIKEESFS